MSHTRKMTLNAVRQLVEEQGDSIAVLQRSLLELKDAYDALEPERLAMFRQLTAHQVEIAALQQIIMRDLGISREVIAERVREVEVEVGRRRKLREALGRASVEVHNEDAKREPEAGGIGSGAVDDPSPGSDLSDRG